MSLTPVRQSGNAPHPAVPNPGQRIGQQAPTRPTQTQAQFRILKKEKITIIQTPYRLQHIPAQKQAKVWMMER